ncbi:MAG: carbohydrate ABC transporter permease [Oscillospiraceae bacterium]|nr:carbohydrate ABC transporter permease [Oscillospiraceae bacterium]
MANMVSNVNPKKFHKSQVKFFVILGLVALFMLLPIIYIINHAFKPVEELFAYPPRFFVDNPTLDNFKRLLDATASSFIPIGRYIFNSLLVTVTVVVLTAFIATLSAYALSKLKFRGRVFLMEFNNFFLMFVSIAVTIPRYLIIQMLGITDTYLAHILPLLATPVGLFLVKQFVDQIPNELIEAAAIDGASEFRTYRSVVLPLIRPAIATCCIMAFQAVWINTETSVMYVENEALKTLAYYMSTLTSNSNIVAGQGIAAASTLIMFVPNIVIFVILQSKMMNTLAHSGIK